MCVEGEGVLSAVSGANKSFIYIHVFMNRGVNALDFFNDLKWHSLMNLSPCGWSGKYIYFPFDYTYHTYLVLCDLCSI